MNKSMLTNILKFLLFLTIGIVILYFVYQSQDTAYQEQCKLDAIAACQTQNIPLAQCDTLNLDCSLIDKVVSDAKQTNYYWILLVLFIYMISNVSRAFRWKMLLDSLGYNTSRANSFWAVMVGYFVNLFIPRAGEVARIGLVSKYEKIPFEKVFGTVVVDRVMDVICLLGLVGLAFILEFDMVWGYLSENLGNVQNPLQNPIILGGLIIGILSLIIAFLFRQKLMQSFIIQKLVGFVTGIIDGVKTVLNLKNPALFFFHTFVIWLMYYLMHYFSLFAFDFTAHLSGVAALMIVVFGAFGMVAPSPGGMGAYHVLVMAALALYGVTGPEGFSFAMILFVAITILCNALFGLIGFVLLPIINSEKEE